MDNVGKKTFNIFQLFAKKNGVLVHVITHNKSINNKTYLLHKKWYKGVYIHGHVTGK